MVPLLIGAMVVVLVQMWAIDYQRKIIRRLSARLAPEPPPDEWMFADPLEGQFERLLRQRKCKESGHLYQRQNDDTLLCIKCGGAL